MLQTSRSSNIGALYMYGLTRYFYQWIQTVAAFSDGVSLILQVFGDILVRG